MRTDCPCTVVTPPGKAILQWMTDRPTPIVAGPTVDSF